MNLQKHYELELARDVRDAAGQTKIRPAPVNEHGELMARIA